MKINKIFLLLAVAVGTCSQANADYASAKAKYDKTQREFALCAATTLQKNDDTLNDISSCYQSVQDALTSQIKEIRASEKGKSKEKESLWRSVNLTHQTGIQSCTEISNSVAYSNFTGYLDLECEASFYISLAEAAIDIHYK